MCFLYYSVCCSHTGEHDIVLARFILFWCSRLLFHAASFVCNTILFSLHTAFTHLSICVCIYVCESFFFLHHHSYTLFILPFLSFIWHLHFHLLSFFASCQADVLQFFLSGSLSVIYSIRMLGIWMRTIWNGFGNSMPLFLLWSLHLCFI